MVRRLKENKVTGILTALLVGIVMFVGMGTMKVNATEYRSGTIDPTTLQVGDTVYVGVELSSDKQIVVCKQCHMIWITYGGSSQYGIGDRINSIVKRSDAHKDHAGYVGYSEFSFYFTQAYLPKNTPYTVMGNSNLGYTIKYNTNGGSAIADAVKQTHIPSIFPTTTKAGYDFIGWYTDENGRKLWQIGMLLITPGLYESMPAYSEREGYETWSFNMYSGAGDSGFFNSPDERLEVGTVDYTVYDQEMNPYYTKEAMYVYNSPDGYVIEDVSGQEFAWFYPSIHWNDLMIQMYGTEAYHTVRLIENYSDYGG